MLYSVLNIGSQKKTNKPKGEASADIHGWRVGDISLRREVKFGMNSTKKSPGKQIRRCGVLRFHSGVTEKSVK